MCVCVNCFYVYSGGFGSFPRCCSFLCKKERGTYLPVSSVAYFVVAELRSSSALVELYPLLESGVCCVGRLRGSAIAAALGSSCCCDVHLWQLVAVWFVPGLISIFDVVAAEYAVVFALLVSYFGALSDRILIWACSLASCRAVNPSRNFLLQQSVSPVPIWGRLWPWRFPRC